MAPISRRMFLVSSVAVVVAACSDSDGDATPTAPPASASVTTPEQNFTSTTSPATTTTLPTPELSGDPFRLGVASGDPDATVEDSAVDTYQTFTVDAGTSAVRVGA